MFLGTGSDVGKSIAVTAFCRILKRRGFRVAPFKAQNMSNNSYVTVEGGEIGRAQVVQAEAAGLVPSVHMNPILLKPAGKQGSQVVMQGKAMGTMPPGEYYALKPRLRRIIRDSYSRLARKYDLIVLEGAGSCCEMNLKEMDLVNLPLATDLNAPCVLVADIDRGGVFAQIMGTFQLMTGKERSLVRGFLINKFRGDPRLFDPGIDYIEKRTSRPVFGVIPFFQHIHTDSEDSVAVQGDRRRIRDTGPGNINIAVLRFPAISNFTDLEILEREKDVVLNYLSDPGELSRDYDCLILPGSKNVMEDGRWLSRRGWKRAVRQFAKGGKRVLGLCGGFQLLGEKIKDPAGVESDRKEVQGLDLLPVETVLEEEKVVREAAGTCLANGKRVRGYEIHMGRSRGIQGTGEPFLRVHGRGEKESRLEGWSLDRGRIAGTYLHGILDSPGFRGEFLNGLRKAKGLKPRPPVKGRGARFKHYDLLADHFEAHCDVERIIRAITKEP